MSQKLWSVTTLVHYLKYKLDHDFAIQRIYLKAELSNFTNHRSGHWYFSLKDESARVSCVMFASNTKQCSIVPKEGMKVLVQVNTSVYESSGQLQLIVLAMEEDGIGEYYQKLEQLKHKLELEGLFSEEHKKPIVNYPNKIVVISGRDTAARKDVLTTLSRRWPLAQIVEMNPLVQGNQASEQIIDALLKADKLDADCIILARGGGSIEDLWCFNNEELARTIYACRTVVISGVGHEVDTTIVDYVSDLRAATPTAAAEMAVPNIEEVMQGVNHLKIRLVQIMHYRLTLARSKLELLQRNKNFMQPELLYQNEWMKLAFVNQRLDLFISKIQRKSYELHSIQEHLNYVASNQIQQQKAALKHNQTLLKERIIQVVKQKQKQMEHNLMLLDAYSPLKIMQRGYSLSYKGIYLIHSIQDVVVDDEISIRLSDGKLLGKITKKENLK